ncbi:MAG: histidine--tRNA ligase [Candidatus Rokuibacteriota bacterium]|nr:MAG: histidine--tRNA ligase [Candidatus Rokubacteria bacterium]
MRDILPDEVELRDAAVHEIVAVYRAYGFRRIETPALEHLTLLAGSEGGENEKLIFKVMKRGEELESARRAGEDVADLGLRFDLTVPLARYYAENHARLPDPLKAIQIGPVWRAERPQKGRFRQFTQCDIDVLGLASPLVEIELILATTDALARLGLSGLTVRINDRRLLEVVARHCGFAEAAHAAFFIAFDKLDRLGAEGVLGELREGGHETKAVRSFEALLPVLQKAEVSIEGLRAAGMGYYTGPIFEIAAAGYPSSIAGGGRYDRMIGRLLGREVPASGFSIGFERLISILGERGGVPAREGAAAPQRRVALLVDDSGDVAAAVRAAKALRAEGYLVSLEVRRKNVKKQLDDLLTHGFWGYAALDDPARAPQVKLLVRRAEAK